MSQLSILQAHRLLGLVPQLQINKEKIQQAYVQAAKKYHPDSRHNPHSHPCAISFRQCGEAREALLRHYAVLRHPITHQTVRKNPVTESIQPLYYVKYRKWTLGLKAFVLFVAACDGMFQKYQGRNN